jgi:hypothetical protein
MKNVGVHHERLEHDAAEEDHNYPQIRQDDCERDLLFFMVFCSSGFDGVIADLIRIAVWPR